MNLSPRFVTKLSATTFFGLNLMLREYLGFFSLKPVVGVQPPVFCASPRSVAVPRVPTLAPCWVAGDSNYGVLGRSWMFSDATAGLGPQCVTWGPQSPSRGCAPPHGPWSSSAPRTSWPPPASHVTVSHMEAVDVFRQSRSET